jgi:hypothetical protein
LAAAASLPGFLSTLRLSFALTLLHSGACAITCMFLQLILGLERFPATLALELIALVMHNKPPVTKGAIT